MSQDSATAGSASGARPFCSLEGTIGSMLCNQYLNQIFTNRWMNGLDF